MCLSDPSYKSDASASSDVSTQFEDSAGPREASKKNCSEVRTAVGRYTHGKRSKSFRWGRRAGRVLLFYLRQPVANAAFANSEVIHSIIHRENIALAKTNRRIRIEGATSNQKIARETFDIGERTPKNSPHALH